MSECYFKGSGTSRSGGNLVTQSSTVVVHEIQNRVRCRKEILSVRKTKNPNCQGGCHNRYRGPCDKKTDSRQHLEIQTACSNGLWDYESHMVRRLRQQGPLKHHELEQAGPRSPRKALRQCQCIPWCLKSICSGVRLPGF